MFRLARDLGMDHRLIERWPAGVLEEWGAFYSFEAKMQRKAQREAEREAKARR